MEFDAFTEALVMRSLGIGQVEGRPIRDGVNVSYQVQAWMVGCQGKRKGEERINGCLGFGCSGVSADVIRFQKFPRR